MPDSVPAAKTISPADLATGDLLFRHASDELFSKLLRKYQGKQFDIVAQHIKDGVKTITRSQAADITHMALAAGPNDVLEFDEGGAGAKILFGSGYGFIRGKMNLPSRRGGRYEVFRCRDEALGGAAADKALRVYDLAFSKTGGGPKGHAGYAVGKIVRGAIFGEIGGGRRNLADFENEYHQWVTTAAAGKRPKIKFICSEFAAYCYCWALLEFAKNYSSMPWLLRIDRAVSSPVEFYTRINECGQGLFEYRGVLST
jgi:hypothetical protein